MRISAVNNYIPFVHNISRPISYGPSFGMTTDQESREALKVKLDAIDGVYLKGVNISNYTKLFRNIKVYQQLPEMLEDKFPDGVRIYDFGCSTGYEPESIIMSLYNKMPKEKVAKYVPILAFDNNAKALMRAISHYRSIHYIDEAGFCFFPNISLDMFYEKQKLTNIPNEIYLGDKSIKTEINGYKKSEVLTNGVTYRKGDIFKCLDSFDFGKAPVVLFFRNATQFMTPEGQKLLANKMWNNLPSGSIVVIGDRDINDRRGTKNRNIRKFLLDNGFKPVEDKYSKDISKTRKMNLGRYGFEEEISENTFFTIINEGDIDGGVETYCFEKP